MIKNILAIAFFCSLSSSQTIIHNPIFDLDSNKSYNIEASILGFDGNYMNLKATLFYRSYGQSTYFNDKMVYLMESLDILFHLHSSRMLLSIIYL